MMTIFLTWSRLPALTSAQISARAARKCAASLRYFRGDSAYRLKQEAEAKRQALALAEKAEERVRQLEAALKSRR